MKKGYIIVSKIYGDEFGKYKSLKGTEGQKENAEKMFEDVRNSKNIHIKYIRRCTENYNIFLFKGKKIKKKKKKNKEIKEYKYINSFINCRSYFEEEVDKDMIINNQIDNEKDKIIRGYYQFVELLKACWNYRSTKDENKEEESGEKEIGVFDKTFKSENTIICIHWGAQEGLKYAKKIEAIINKEEELINLTHISSKDGSFFTNLNEGSEEDLKFSLEYYWDKAKDKKKIIYEVMESIVILYYPQSTIKRQITTVSDKEKNTESEEENRIKIKLVNSIERLYNLDDDSNDLEKLKKYFKIKNRRNNKIIELEIIINDLYEFRNSYINYLRSIYGPIYS